MSLLSVCVLQMQGAWVFGEWHEKLVGPLLALMTPGNILQLFAHILNPASANICHCRAPGCLASGMRSWWRNYWRS